MNGRSGLRVGLGVGMRVGLTGGLGSGKSTVAAMFAKLGAHVLSADDLARSLMQPGQAVYGAIIEHFGSRMVRPDGALDRAALAKAAFADGRVEELNTIVHPATIALQTQLADDIFAAAPDATVLVESALLFETKHAAGWPGRFDRIVLVTASESAKIARFVERSGGENIPLLETEARRRLAQMIPDAQKLSQVDYVLRNEGSIAELQSQVEALWTEWHNPQA